MAKAKLWGPGWGKKIHCDGRFRGLAKFGGVAPLLKHTEKKSWERRCVYGYCTCTERVKALPGDASR